MKLVALGAGRRKAIFSRRHFLQGAIAAVSASLLGPAFAEGPALLSPAGGYFGARILRRTDPQGFPVPAPDAFGPMTMFVAPVGVSAGPLDIYIADAGLSALFRYDPSLDAMAVVSGVRVTEQTRVAAVQDGSVVVSEGRLGMPRRFSRAGRPLQTINPMNVPSRFDDIVVDPASGRYFGLDRVQRQIEEVQPLGRSAGVLPSELLPGLPGALALDKQTLYAAGQDCHCIVAIDLFRRDKQVIAEDFTDVTALAAGDGWLIVADNVERVLRIYKDNVLRGDPGYDQLNLVNPRGFSIARGMLYVADAGARRVSIFRLRP